MHTDQDQQPPEPPAEDEDEQPTPGPGRIRWLDVRFNGSLVCRVNAADPTHIQLATRAYGQKRVIEVSTKAASVTTT